MTTHCRPLAFYNRGSCVIQAPFPPPSPAHHDLLAFMQLHNKGSYNIFNCMLLISSYFLTLLAEYKDVPLLILLYGYFSIIMFNRYTGKWFEEKHIWQAKSLCKAINHALTTASEVMETAPWTDCQDVIANQYHQSKMV